NILSLNSFNTLSLATGDFVFGPGISSGTTITNISPAINLTGYTTFGSPDLGVASTAGLALGMHVLGVGIPNGAYITALPASIMATGNSTVGSAALTGLSSLAGLTANMTVTAAG